MQMMRLHKGRHILTARRHRFCFSVLKASVSQPVLSLRGAEETVSGAGHLDFSLGSVWPPARY